MLVAALVLLAACDDVTFVERLVVVNETAYSASVEVRGEGDGWLPITTVSPHETRVVAQVVDQGPSWTFRFSYGGHDSVELTLSKRELIDADWRVEVSDELEDSLRREGVPPP